MKVNFFLSVFFLIFCGCESMDHERMDSNTSSNEPAWSSFAKENNMDWSEHYWSDREVKGNRGYLNSNTHKPSKSKSDSSSAATFKKELADEKPTESVDTAVSQRIYPETVHEIPAPVIPQSRENSPISLDSKNLDLEREETMEVGPEEVQPIKTMVQSSSQKQELRPEQVPISQSKPEKIKTDSQIESLPPAKKAANVVPVKIEKKTPVIQKKVQTPQKTENIKSQPREYIVKKGENLWKIAGLQEVYGDSTKWQKIYDANRNKLKSPNHVYPGQVLIIPRE